MELKKIFRDTNKSEVIRLAIKHLSDKQKKIFGGEYH